MNKPSRCFIAIEISSKVRAELTGLQDQLKAAQADISWARPKQIHLTLKFMAKVHRRNMDKLMTALPETLKDYPSFTMEISGIGAFPSVDRPRVIWTGINQGKTELSALVERIEQGLGQVGIKKESKPFAAHLTLGRVRSLKNFHALQKKIKEAESFSPLSQEVDSVTLFQSILTPQGPIHNSLLRVKLQKAS